MNGGFRMSAVVKTDGLNIHYMPGGTTIRHAIPRGTKVVITAWEQRPQYRWAYVEVPGGENGWCRADFLRFDPPAPKGDLPHAPTLELPPIVKSKPTPLGAVLVLVLTGAMIAYGLASVAFTLWHEVPLPH